MPERGANKVGAGCAIAGALLLLVGTYLHPMSADPNDPVAAFTEYAADHLWVASHLTQLAGIVLMMAALILLSRQLEAGRAAGLARVAAATAIASLAIAAALQAVDGVALKVMVNAWAAASEVQKDGAFHAAFAVRQIEVGLATMLNLILGVTACIYAVALLGDRIYPKWLALFALVGGVPTLVAGVMMAYTGFSNSEMAVGMPANIILLAWMIALGVLMLRRDRDHSAPAA
jgi:hypothetical protein